MKHVLQVKQWRQTSASLVCIQSILGLAPQPKIGRWLMARWIAFDQETTSLLRSNLAQGTKIDTLRRGPVDYALAKPGSVVAVLPAQGNNDLGIAVFRPVRPAVAQPPAQQHPAVAAQPPRAAVTPQPKNLATRNFAATRAGGFLGLTDEPAFEEEEEPQEKTGWWRRFWEE